MTDRRAACFRVTFGILEDLLRLPEGHKIRRVTSEIAGAWSWTIAFARR